MDIMLNNKSGLKTRVVVGRRTKTKVRFNAKKAVCSLCLLASISFSGLFIASIVDTAIHNLGPHTATYGTSSWNLITKITDKYNSNGTLK